VYPHRFHHRHLNIWQSLNFGMRLGDMIEFDPHKHLHVFIWDVNGSLRHPTYAPSSYIMDHGGLDRGPCRRPTVHTLGHTHWMCCYSVMTPPGHMTSIVLSILERDPPRCSPEGFFTLFPPWKGFFYFLWVFPDPMWGQRSKGQGCLCVQIVKPSGDHL